MMPTYERRYYLGLLNRDNIKREEYIESQKEKSKTTNGKGKRTTTMSGDQLKSQMNSGNIPIN